MQNVVCCNTRVKYVLITWAHCTRVASVRAPEGSLHRFVRGQVGCARGPLYVVLDELSLERLPVFARNSTLSSAHANFDMRSLR
jgi:hypothetical protein